MALIPIFSVSVFFWVDRFSSYNFFGSSSLIYHTIHNSFILTFSFQLVLVLTSSFIFLDSKFFLANLAILIFWTFDLLMEFRRIVRGSFGGMLSGSWIRITFLILLNSLVGWVWGGCSFVKPWSAVFTGNSGVSKISVIFLILRCNGLSMLLTYHISIISTTLAFVISNTVGVILLLDLGLFLIFLCFGTWGVIGCSRISCLCVSSNSSSSLSDASLRFDKSLWSCCIASFL